MLSCSPSIIFISVTLSRSTRREIQAVSQPPLPSPSPSAQPILATMGWFSERSGVDAKLSEGSLFDLLLPIYKHESANGKKRACVRACMLGRRGARTLQDDASGKRSRKRKGRKSAKRRSSFYRISCVGSLYARLYSPTSIICIRYSGTHHANVLLTATSPCRSPLSSSFRLFSYLGSAGRLVVVVVNIAQRGKRHARVAAAAVTLR